MRRSEYLNQSPRLGTGNTFNTMGQTQQPTANSSPFGSIDYFKNNLKGIGGNYKFGNRDIAEGGIAGLMPGYFYGIAQQSQNAPGYYNSLQQQLQQMNPAGNAMRADTMRQNALGASQDTIANTIAQLLRGGMGIGARQGAGIAGVNQANQQAAQFAADQASAEEQYKQMQAMQQIYQMLMGNPLLESMNAAYGQKMNNKATQSTGALGGLGGALGMATGMGWSPFK